MPMRLLLFAALFVISQVAFASCSLSLDNQINFGSQPAFPASNFLVSTTARINCTAGESWTLSTPSNYVNTSVGGNYDAILLCKVSSCASPFSTGGNAYAGTGTGADQTFPIWAQLSQTNWSIATPYGVGAFSGAATLSLTSASGTATATLSMNGTVLGYCTVNNNPTPINLSKQTFTGPATGTTSWSAWCSGQTAYTVKADATCKTVTSSAGESQQFCLYWDAAYSNGAANPVAATGRHLTEYFSAFLKATGSDIGGGFAKAGTSSTTFTITFSF